MRGFSAALSAARCVAATACAADGPTTVELVHDDSGYHLERDGEPYTINGVGGMRYLDELQAHGGNSVRTWGIGDIRPRKADDGTVYSPLDEAHKRGLSICVGLWVQHPRHGFDYNNAEAVAKQRERFVAEVREYKDHPAVLMWGVGNEATIATDNTVQVLKEVNELARLIKLEDPNHPTMHAIPGPWDGLAGLFAEHCPDVDILGVNAYAGLRIVPDELEQQGYTGPYVVTEFGPPGHWEVKKASWGAQVEPTSTIKARSTLECYEIAVRDRTDRCVGSYVFLWGDKQECTDTWFGMFLSTGEKLAAVDTISHAWTGTWPDNRAPHIDRLETAAALERVQPGAVFDATLFAEDPDGDELSYRWLVRAESTDRRTGGDREAAPPEIDGCVLGDPGRSIKFRTPAESGAYRLFVYVYDGNGAAGTANLPFFVE